MSALQRFCPLCDRSFQDGEAVLKCEGCGVLHHPGCWVTNGGCATQAEHSVTPQALAYTSGIRPVGSPAPHPGEGTRAPAQPPADAPIPLRPQARAEPPPVIGDAQSPPMIGADHPATVHRSLPEDVVPPVGTGPRRYTPPPGEQMPRKPMPQIYERHRLFAYWYVPVAVILAIGVALGVIFAAERLFGGDGEPQPTATETPDTAETVTQSPAETPSPTTETTGTPDTETPEPSVTTGPGIFSAGDTVVVFNTGDCLNVRTAPGINDPETGELNPAIICIADGTRVTVTGGPEEAGSLTWWKVETVLGEGWAAQDYLQLAE